LDRFASANLVPSEARDSPRYAANNPSGRAIYSRFNCHDTPKRSFTQVKNLLNP
jgi:hypothetical protein